jgi:hypothetical protein
MEFKFLYHSIITIIFTPSKAWDIAIKENKPVKYLRNNLLLPLSLLVTIAVFLGSLIFTNTTLSWTYSLFTSVKYFFLILVVTYCSAMITGEITKPLDLGKDFNISFRLILYSLTPFFFCQIVSHLFESLIFINVLALFGLYIFWTGAEKMLNPPDYKKMPMLVAVFFAFTGFFFAGDWVLSSVMERIYNLIFS